MLPLLRIFKSRLALKSLLTWLVGWKFKEQIVPMSGLDLVRSPDNVTMSRCHSVTKCHNVSAPGEVRRREVGATGEGKPCCCQPESWSFEAFKTSKSGWCGSLHLGNWRLMDLQILEVFTMLFTFIPMLCDDEQCPLSGESKIGDVSPLSWECYFLYVWHINIYDPHVLRTEGNLDIFGIFLSWERTAIQGNFIERHLFFLLFLDCAIMELITENLITCSQELLLCLCLSVCVYCCVYVYLCVCELAPNPKMGWIVTSSKSVVFRAVCALPIVVT